MLKKIVIFSLITILLLYIVSLILEPSAKELFERHVKKPIPNTIKIIEYGHNQQACALKFLSKNKNDIKNIISKKELILTNDFNKELNNKFSALSNYIFSLFNEIEFDFDESTTVYSNFNFVRQNLYQSPKLEFIFIQKNIYIYMCVYTD